MVKDGVRVFFDKPFAETGVSAQAIAPTIAVPTIPEPSRLKTRPIWPPQSTAEIVIIRSIGKSCVMRGAIAGGIYDVRGTSFSAFREPVQ